MSGKDHDAPQIAWSSAYALSAVLHRGFHHQ